MIESGRSAAR